VHIVIGPDLTVATEHGSPIEDGIQRRLEGEKVGVTFERTGRELRIRRPPADAPRCR
jgi:hypothetical protein